MAEKGDALTKESLNEQHATSGRATTAPISRSTTSSRPVPNPALTDVLRLAGRDEPPRGGDAQCFRGEPLRSPLSRHARWAERYRWTRPEGRCRHDRSEGHPHAARYRRPGRNGNFSPRAEEGAQTDAGRPCVHFGRIAPGPFHERRAVPSSSSKDLERGGLTVGTLSDSPRGAPRAFAGTLPHRKARPVFARVVAETTVIVGGGAGRTRGLDQIPTRARKEKARPSCAIGSCSCSSEPGSSYRSKSCTRSPTARAGRRESCLRGSGLGHSRPPFPWGGAVPVYWTSQLAVSHRPRGCEEPSARRWRVRESFAGSAARFPGTCRKRGPVALRQATRRSRARIRWPAPRPCSGKREGCRLDRSRAR
jgi:hypothetical protein